MGVELSQQELQDALEKLLFRVEKLRELQRKYWTSGRHQHDLTRSIQEELRLDKEVRALKLLGFNTDRFHQARTNPTQPGLF